LPHQKENQVNTEHPPQGGGRLVRVPLSDLIPNTRLQVREKLSERTVARYVKLLRDGGQFAEPISAARIKGQVYIVDGFHRREAYTQTGATLVEVMLEEMSWEQAIYRAAQANQKHGLHLSVNAGVIFPWRAGAIFPHFRHQEGSRAREPS